MVARRSDLETRAQAALELRQRQARRAIIGSLRRFIEAFWVIVEPRRELIWGWHMDLICEELVRAYRGELPGSLVINIPPRHSKSSLVSVLGPAWWWLHRPESQFLAITKADKNAKRDARYMRRIVSSPEYRALVAQQVADGKTQAWDWSPDQNELKYYSNTVGGHRISNTAGASITGAGADYLLIDDPHDASEVNGTVEQSARAMEDCWEDYTGVWSQRLNPGGMTMCIMQRLHENDLAGRLLAQPDTTAVVLPLEFEPAHPHRHPRDMRQEGELLTTGRFSEKDLRRYRANPQIFAGQAQQRPTPKGGGQIKRAWFRRFYRTDPREMARTCQEVWITSDAAKKATATADYHAIQVWGRKDAMKLLLARRHERLTYPEYERIMDALVTEWRPHGVLVEDTANGTTYLQYRQSKIHNLIAFHPNQTPGSDKSKAARAIYIERAAEADQIELPDPAQHPWVEEWLHFICNFPAAAHDDDVDATSQILMRWSLAPDPQAEMEATLAMLGRTQRRGR